MKERRVIIPLSVRLYMDEIADFIMGVSRPEHAVRYVHEMVAERHLHRYYNFTELVAETVPKQKKASTFMRTLFI